MWEDVKMDIVFRTNAGRDTGLGHLVRCANLARELAAQGARCLFVLDCLEESVRPFVAGLDVCDLYDSPQRELDQGADARLFMEVLEKRPYSWVLLDDYRLGLEWEGIVGKAGVKICVVDDLVRSHQCDVLVDIRWRGEDTPSRYDGLVSDHTRKLLGPDFVMLAPDYKASRPPRKDYGHFTIMIGTGGGGGDLDIFMKIMDSILGGREHFDDDVRLVPVVGPLSGSVDDFLTRYEGNEYVKPLVGETELYPHLCETDFYIGAAGGMLYQLLALQVPALTFSVAENQRNDLRLLEDVGHFFHIENWTEAEAEMLPAFIGTVQRHYDRIRKMGASAKVVVDGQGAARVAQVLLDPAGEVLGRNPVVSAKRHEERSLSAEHRLRKVCDGDINHYLASRNLDANCRNMTSVEKIHPLHHYTWWFNARRESFLLSKNDIPCLYIWHECKSLQGRDYLIGGWFVCGGETSFQESLLALNWQLEYCDDHYPGTPWIAVINRQNNYVKLLNDYVGFAEVAADHPYGRAISEIFRGAGCEDFYFVVREYSGASLTD